MFGKGSNGFIETGIFAQAKDIAARYHDIIYAVFREMEQVTQHQTLGRRQVALVFGRVAFLYIFLMFGNFFFELLTQRRFMIASE